MTTDAVSGSSPFLPRTGFDALVRILTSAGYRCIGPHVEAGAVSYQNISGLADLPQGMEEDQSPGYYRLRETGTPRAFAWSTGPQALKPHLFAPRESLWRVSRDADNQLTFTQATPVADKLAVIGVRACDLAALALQDSHFLSSAGRDENYAVRREGLFLVAVNCTHPADTCFCVSTGDGPQAEQGYDLVLDELDDGYLVQAGSAEGQRILRQLNLTAATSGQHQQVEREQVQARERQTRSLPSRNLRDALFAAWEHPRWQQVAERCLSCTNCTLVCPTCFCHRQGEEPQLDGSASHHYREWDSCFTQNHSYIHGITLRADTRARYRQWLTHKLGSWHDQFGRSGCVGCGRCITWCPVGIDITEEVAELMQESSA